MAYRGTISNGEAADPDGSRLHARLAKHGLADHIPTLSGTGSNGGSPVSDRVKTLSAVGLSVVSSVSIVTCNKYLMSDLGFQQATTLTGMHTIACILCMRLALFLGWMEYKTCPKSAILTFGLMQGISIGFLNLSLGFNSVGFYQMTKLAIIPFTVMVETVAYRKQYSAGSLASILLLLLGVGIATVTDVQLNLKGAILSVCAIVTTCLAQIWTGTTQKRYGLSSAQLLYHASPYMAVTLCATGPLLDYTLTGSSVLSFTYTYTSMLFIIVSCSIAVAVNMATFLVIGRCDAVTYQVLGHAKTVLVLGYGFLRLNTLPSGRNMFGIIVAMAGMVSYGVCREREKERESAKVQRREEHDEEALSAGIKKQ